MIPRSPKSIESLAFRSTVGLAVLCMVFIIVATLIAMDQAGQSLLETERRNLEQVGEKVAAAIAGDLLLGDNKSLAIRLAHRRELHGLDKAVISAEPQPCDPSGYNTLSFAFFPKPMCWQTAVDGTNEGAYLLITRSVTKPPYISGLIYLTFSLMPLLAFAAGGVFLVKRQLQRSIVEPITELSQNMLKDIKNYVWGNGSETDFKRQYDTKELNELSNHILYIAKELRDSFWSRYEIMNENATNKAVALTAQKLAHDLNRPLSHALFYFHRIGEIDDPIKIKELAKKVIGRLEELVSENQSLLHQLIDVGKKGKICPTPTRIEPIIESAITSYPSQTEKDFRTELDFSHRNYPLLDRIAIERVFTNLIDNAKKWVNHCGTISVTSEDLNKENRPFVRVKVHNTGSYISPEDATDFFKPWKKSCQSKGYGLGLAICRDIVQDHSGHISVVSHPKDGTTFIVEIPSIVKDVAPEENYPPIRSRNEAQQR